MEVDISHLRSICWVWELGGDVEHKALHDIHLLVPNFHLQTKKSQSFKSLWNVCASEVTYFECGSCFDEVSLKDVVKAGIQLLLHILN